MCFLTVVWINLTEIPSHISLENFFISIFWIIMKDKVWIRVYKRVHVNLYEMDDIIHTKYMFGIYCQSLRDCLLTFLFWFWGHHFYLLCTLGWSWNYKLSPSAPRGLRLQIYTTRMDLCLFTYKNFTLNYLKDTWSNIMMIYIKFVNYNEY